MEPQWEQDVRRAFAADEKLANRIIDLAHAQTDTGELPMLFGHIAQYVLSLPNSSAPVAANPKKRKLDEADEARNGAGGDAVIENPSTSFDCKNVSFQMPARKKLRLRSIFDPSHATRRQLQLLNPQTGSVEFTLSNSQVDQAFCLPVPEKQQRQWNFCLLPQAGAVSADGSPCEQMVFTMGETKPDDASSATGPFPDGFTYVSATGSELNQFLHSCGKQVVMPNEAEFVSSIVQSHRKSEKAYHVKAHKGTKEGYLFFLTNGVVFGFKKPLSFFPFSAIESISYTSVLQRTFNLVIAATEGSDSEVKEVEFSMLDQADFAGIDEYVKRHGLNDASMAAERKAKAYNVNKEGKGTGAVADGEEGAVNDEADPGKTEQELQDEEDELEEDYEASGGESDGEGESSEEEDDDGDADADNEEMGEEEG